MTLENSRFTKINDAFECTHCGHATPKASATCRDHCPRCLYSLHVDVNPGDRAANCGGELKPVAYSVRKNKGTMIHYVCVRCGEKRINKFLEVDGFEGDSFDTLLTLNSVTEVNI